MKYATNRQIKVVLALSESRTLVELDLSDNNIQ